MDAVHSQPNTLRSGHFGNKWFKINRQLLGAEIFVRDSHFTWLQESQEVSIRGTRGSIYLSLEIDVRDSVSSTVYFILTNIPMKAHFQNISDKQRRTNNSALRTVTAQ